MRETAPTLRNSRIAVNRLNGIRCRWQMKDAFEQEETTSNAQRFKQAVRLCF